MNDNILDQLKTTKEPAFFEDGSICQLNEGPFFQCCCTCKYHVPVNFHCCTEPKPTEEQKAAAGVDGRCVCGVQKGWACAIPQSDCIHDNWPTHSCGCEMHTKKA